MKYIVHITGIEQITHDVKCFRVEKPAGYMFMPGQATDVSINKPGLEDELRPFTFTGLNRQPYLEFTIKRYADHQGMTDKLHNLAVGEQLIIRDAWGAIAYKGPGYFIAGGAGLTPFMAILRQLHSQHAIAGNTLFFANKSAQDIIYRDELIGMLGPKAIFVVTREENTSYRRTHIDEAFLQQHIDDRTKHFYVCGPDAMVADILQALQKMDVSAQALVFEK